MPLTPPVFHRRSVWAAWLFAAAALPAAAAPLDPLAYASLGTLNLGPGSYTLDTGGALPRLLDSASSVLAVGVLQPQADAFNPQVAVFTFDSVQLGLGATVRATGASPVALLSRSGITLAGVFDAAGRDGGPQGAGAGGAAGPGGGRGGDGGVKLGALSFITLVGHTTLSVAGGSFAGGLAVNSGRGAGGGLLLHAPSITLQSDPSGAPVLDASGFSGGRITFQTASGAVAGNTAGVTVGANFYGQVGVITYGTPAAVPEPASVLLWFSGGAVLLLAVRRGACAGSAGSAR